MTTTVAPAPALAPGTHVQFSENEHTPGCGTITRVWDKPAADPYVTIKTCDDGRTFVRCSSRVLAASMLTTISPDGAR